MVLGRVAVSVVPPVDTFVRLYFCALFAVFTSWTPVPSVTRPARLVPFTAIVPPPVLSTTFGVTAVIVGTPDVVAVTNAPGVEASMAYLSTKSQPRVAHPLLPQPVPHEFSIFTP